MAAETVTRDSDSRQEIEVFKAYLDTTKDTIQQRFKLIDDAAKHYAEMATGQKPSYIGMLLVSVSVTLEVIEAISPNLVTFSDITSTTMLVGGLILMAAGAGIETVAFHLNVKLASAASEEARKQLKELESEKAGLFEWFLGRRRSR